MACGQLVRQESSMSWITSLMMASGWSCAENAQAKAHDDDDDDDVDDDDG